jgi:hypothetical protein
MNKAQERFEAKRNEALSSLLGDAPADARAAAAAVLEKELLGVVNAWTEAWVKAPATLDLFLRLSRDADARVADAALVALVRMAWSYAVEVDLGEALTRGFVSSAPKTRRWAAEGMSLVGDASLWERLLPLVDDADKHVRSTVMLSLSRRAAGEAPLPDALRARWLAAARAASKDRDRAVRESAALALKALAAK